MINVLALFPNTIEKDVLNDLTSKMIPALKQADGLRLLKLSEGHIMSPGSPPPYSKVIEATFESLEAFMAWVQTPAAQAGRDEMITNGVIRIYYEVNELVLDKWN